MITNVNRHTIANKRLLMAIALLFGLSLSAGFAIADEKHQEERLTTRIKNMHAKLNITPDQEEKWSRVDTSMREDAKIMDTLTQARHDHAKQMTAIDDLNSYAEITTAHADGIKKLIPLFTALYDSMSDAQKKSADALFQHGDHHFHQHKQGEKKQDDQS
ncbi:Spy/CpxP family protein refolding chaperone [Methylomonas sp. AM2-LC]|uniref:Spy/CpxP family protein refolding chaperone n=1 Tax=Methylomonas sp. AM2-LC TaxID=3153301 RepID=UPI0032674CB5